MRLDRFLSHCRRRECYAVQLRDQSTLEAVYEYYDTAQAARRASERVRSGYETRYAGRRTRYLVQVTRLAGYAETTEVVWLTWSDAEAYHHDGGYMLAAA